MIGNRLWLKAHALPSDVGAFAGAFEEAACIADAAYDDAPNGHYDNGATQDGWQMACVEIAKRLRAASVSP